MYPAAKKERRNRVKFYDPKNSNQRFHPPIREDTTLCDVTPTDSSPQYKMWDVFEYRVTRMKYFTTLLSPDNGGAHDTTNALALTIETLTSRTGLGAGQTNRQTDRQV